MMTSSGGGTTFPSDFMKPYKESETASLLQAQKDKVKAETSNIQAGTSNLLQVTKNNVAEEARIKADTYLKNAQVQQALTQSNLNIAQKQKVIEEARQKFIDNEIAERTGQNTGGPKSLVGGNVQDFVNYINNAVKIQKNRTFVEVKH